MSGEEKRDFPTRYHRKKFENQQRTIKKVSNQIKKSVFSKPSNSGFIIRDDPEEIVTQKDIIQASDLGTASKRFSLDLDHGPYALDFSRNGRYLIIMGKHGHMGAFDWLTKKALFEINVHEVCRDIKFLHQETMFAASQKEYVYIYDKQGVELHCMKKLYKVLQMQFLPYHFLLACSSETSYLSYLDITTGEIVADYCTNSGRLDKMCQNPTNGIIFTGHKTGTVSMWIPSSKRSVVKLFCHNTPISALDVNITGEILATTGMDNKLKLWDIRNPGVNLTEVNMHNCVQKLKFSQKNLLSCASSNLVQIFKDIHLASTDEGDKRSYLSHFSRTYIRDVSFCPYEDVLGIGSNNGIETVLVPGASEANYDALEENPYQSLKARQEREVRRLLDKIPFELINVGQTINQVDTENIEEEWEKTRKALMGETDPIEEIKIKNKKKGKSKPVNQERRKQIMRLDRKKISVENIVTMQKNTKFNDLVNDGQEKIKKETEHIENWKKPSDLIIKNKRLAKKRTKNALDLLIPPKRLPQ